jgi:hypothetical protein
MLTHKKLFEAPDLGRSLVRPWIKNPSVVTASGIAIDLTVFGRFPAANYYTDGASLTSRALRRSTDGGLDHGEDKGSAFKKFVGGMTIFSTTALACPMPLQLLDYLLYYPLIPMEDVQTLINTVPLPRHTTGEGVQIMMVEQFPYVGGVTFRVNYTNSRGVAGRLSAICTVNTQTALGTIATSAPATLGCPGTFVPLQQGDGGVRSIESIEFFTPDAGNLAAVLVKPLTPFANYENVNPSDWDMWRHLGITEQIQDDAYLSMVCTPLGSLSGAVIEGQLKTYWVEA